MDIDWNFLFLYSFSEWRIWAQCCSSSTSTIKLSTVIKWHRRILFFGPDHDPLCHFLLEPMTDALLFCCGQFEAIFCQYTFVSKFQFSGPLESIWTHDINFLLRIEWILWKNKIFFILGQKKGVFRGIKTFNPQYFWPIILPNFLGGGYLPAPEDLI